MLTFSTRLPFSSRSETGRGSDEDHIIISITSHMGVKNRSAPDPLNFISATMASSTSGTSITLSTRQEKALCALIDAFLPPLPDPRNTSLAENTKQDDPRPRSSCLRSQKAAETHYWTHRLSSDPDFMAYIKSRLTRKQCQSLSLLSTVSGTRWATGRPFHVVSTLADWPVPQLAPLVQDALSKSRRVGGAGRVRFWQSWKRFLCGAAFLYVTRKENGKGGVVVGGGIAENPYAWKALDYPGPCVLERGRDAHAVTEGLELLRKLNMSDRLTDLSSSNEYDIIVVGSGAGGAMAARVLSQAGWNVVVVEQGLTPRWPDRLLEMDCSYGRPMDGKTDVLLWTGGITPNLGGATRFGMGICQELPVNVRQEWMESFGLNDFANQGDGAFDESLRFILNDIREFTAQDHHLSTTTKSNASLHSILEAGCDRLALKSEGGRASLIGPATAGMATLGDRYVGTKRTSLTDLSLAPNVRILTGSRVKKVRTESVRGMMLPRATGIEYFEFRSGETKFLRAKKCVIVAAGALETPCLLRRSGLNQNRHIGRHLHLHPASTVFGFLPHAGSRYLVDPDISTVCEQGTNGDGRLLHALTLHPGLLAMLLPWSSPQKFKERMVRLRHVLPIVCMQRDTSEGYVNERRDGTVVINYKLNKVDRTRILETVQAALLVEAAAGASEISTGSFRDPGVIVSGDDSSAGLGGYLRYVEQLGMHGWDNNLLSMHQMGSARMASTPNKGAVDPNGEAWECNDFFVMDSSLFPTAIGVHPMITVMVIARMLSKRLAERLRSRESVMTLPAREPSGEAGAIFKRRRLHAMKLSMKASLHLVARFVLAMLLFVPFLLWLFEVDWLEELLSRFVEDYF